MGGGAGPGKGGESPWNRHGRRAVVAGDRGPVSELESVAEASAPEASAPAGRSAPRVRTLLVCDLADSTALVERLGDGAAADLFRRHDRAARALLHEHGGTEIDKTDGFLALFERPVQAVAFALAYHRALRTLGEEERQTLRARVGVHIGEVVLWENAATDVAGGAKRIDVEGLAKPVAARLMALALPGQTLLSGIAFSLAQRAAGELAAPREIRWLTHGRYRFKGVPAPMLVHEVGEAGSAPLHAPPSSAKAERDLPLWRKPGVLALEALALIAAIAVPVALSLRAPPAIAFGERDWVVVGGLRNLTGEATLDESLETAFRISLEQSRYVNVLPDLKLRDSLARMQRPADTDVDRAVASEIALREGARAVILPTVAEVGGRVRVSAEVIDPHTQTTVYAESADGVGAESALGSIDSVTHELRARLGEALAAIDTDSAPLPRVTSGNIDALRAYALAAQAQGQTRNDEARALYERAVEIDPEFALAHIGLARLKMSVSDRAGAIGHARRAHELRERLTPRDALYVDAWLATFGPPSVSMGKWKLLAELYPDYFAGSYNYASYAAQHANRYGEAIEFAARAVSPQNPLLASVHYTLGSLYTADERFEEAARQFSLANSLGETAAGEYQAGLALAQGQREQARAILEGVNSGIGDVERALQQGSYALIAVDAGRMAEARAILAKASTDGALDAVWRDVFRAGALSVDSVDPQADPVQASRAFVESQRGAAADSANIERDHALFLTLLGGYLAARNGSIDVADGALAQAESAALESGYPNVEALARIARAERLRAAGEAEAAYSLLAPMLDGTELYQARSAALRALRDAGQHDEALQQAEWLIAHRGRAFIEWGNHRSQTVLNAIDARVAMLDRAELLETLGNRDTARVALDEFERIWTQPPAPIAERSRALRARLQD